MMLFELSHLRSERSRSDSFFWLEQSWSDPLSIVTFSQLTHFRSQPSRSDLFSKWLFIDLEMFPFSKWLFSELTHFLREENISDGTLFRSNRLRSCSFFEMTLFDLPHFRDNLKLLIFSDFIKIWPPIGRSKIYTWYLSFLQNLRFQISSEISGVLVEFGNLRCSGNEQEINHVLQTSNKLKISKNTFRFDKRCLIYLL